MKVIRCLAVLLSLSVVLMLQGCGDDTGGALSITTKNVDNLNQTYSVVATITYTPPSGKSAQGVEVITTATGFDPDDKTKLTSNSNSFTLTYLMPQLSGASNYLQIESSIGSMKASTLAVIPPIAIATP
ncbi:MAG: hypothetical protein PHP95_05345 [Desulfuromonadaceae bacterium]|nr:hypothetical protein [Desulfuromonadaceae bacterium]MDD2847864.1 hypothetical protein [Desulfuromonadaceae bacterium]MDD4129591.1 hypothetical protein [Desulfuromonadaceae bacterium]